MPKRSSPCSRIPAQLRVPLKNEFLITNKNQLKAHKGKEPTVLFSWASAAWMAAAKPPGMGLSRPMKTIRLSLVDQLSLLVISKIHWHALSPNCSLPSLERKAARLRHYRHRANRPPPRSCHPGLPPASGAAAPPAMCRRSASANHWYE